mmetsp:Transcript_34484/g.104031  ORF Transcript_34484/g.104031 Transcript_34484/m.104031 type:complete len:151 (+) Transcript_34484:227-679(+)
MGIDRGSAWLGVALLWRTACAVAVPGGLSDLGPGEACGPSMIGHLGGCADGLACECVGDCADPFIGDAPSTCVPEDGFEGRRLGEACGPSMIGNLGKCAAGYSCECVGFCADPFVADAPHTCVVPTAREGALACTDGCRRGARLLNSAGP